MSDLAWPRWALPKPLQDGYGPQLIPAVSRLDVEAGPPRQWQAFGSDYRVVNLTLWRLKEAQQLVLDEFYVRTTQQGSLPFDIQLEDGRPLDWWAAMFLGPPQQSWASGYRITAQCRLLLIGEPFAARAALILGANFDATFQMRAKASATFAIQATFDSAFEMQATPIDAGVPLAAVFDARFAMVAAGTLNPAGALEAVFDAQFVMQAISAFNRLLEDGAGRLTEIGDARSVE